MHHQPGHPPSHTTSILLGSWPQPQRASIHSTPGSSSAFRAARRLAEGGKGIGLGVGVTGDIMETRTVTEEGGGGRAGARVGVCTEARVRVCTEARGRGVGGGVSSLQWAVSRVEGWRVEG